MRSPKNLLPKITDHEGGSGQTLTLNQALNDNQRRLPPPPSRGVVYPSVILSIEPSLCLGGWNGNLLSARAHKVEVFNFDQSSRKLDCQVPCIS
ncbi:hypothetical protein TNCV_2345171 [Trichonephila clavipes]|nr:hypothetical protein TNCV_2345171 [Trichonephila clavipes]